MSIYRFARMSALLAFAGRYRMKIFNMCAAAAFAAVTAWLYGDVAAYLETHHPSWVAVALVVKTLIVYGALFFLLWQVRPSEREAARETAGKAATSRPDAIEHQAPSKLDELAAKPKLTSRKDAILNK